MSVLMLVMFFVAFVLACTVVGSAAYLLPRLRDNQRKLEGGESASDVARLQESIDELTSQVRQLEEEKDFYRALGSPEGTPQSESESEEEGP